MFNLLEGDGLIDNLYHLLWIKDSIFGVDPYVLIPHTIIYKYSKPCYWYFTSKQDSKLKKKSSNSITSDKIKEEFLKNYDEDIGIVAYFIYNKSLSSKYKKNHENDKENQGLVVEYFNKKRFLEVLLSKMPCDDGVLQKFEAPKGERNFIIRLYWCPKTIILEKKTNIRSIKDKKCDIYEKAVTYEGKDFQVETQPIKGTNLPDRIEKIAKSIISHISSISLERIKIIRMILNFKITNDDKILVLWCSSLRIDKSNERTQFEIEPTNLKKVKIEAPTEVNLFSFTCKGYSIKDVTCLNCSELSERNRLYRISFRNLIEAHDNRKHDKDYFLRNYNQKYTSTGVEIIPYIENKEEKSKSNYLPGIYSNNNSNNNSINMSINQISNNHSTYLSNIQYNNSSNSSNTKVNMLIPKVILELYPKMKYDQYENLKVDEVFKSKNTKVCEKCFVLLTKYCSLGGSNVENVIRTLERKGKKENFFLKPGKIGRS